MYAARSSGLLTGGGVRRPKRRRNVIREERLKHFRDCHLSDTTSIKKLIPDFDPELEFEYTPRELLLLAERILLLDSKVMTDKPCWLNGPALRERSKREIYVANGIPDPSIASGLYWRTHPQGRRFRTAHERRESSTSFYV